MIEKLVVSKKKMSFKHVEKWKKMIFSLSTLVLAQEGYALEFFESILVPWASL